MAEELQKVASEIVDKVVEVAESEIEAVPAASAAASSISTSITNGKSPAKKSPVAAAVAAAKVPSVPGPDPVISQKSVLCTMFCPYTWFDAKKMNPKVETLIYWRCPKRSGAVFAGVLLILLALSYISLISVIAYLSLAILTGTIAFRIYKNIVQAIQKTGDGHPFKTLLDWDIAIPQEKAQELLKVIVAHLNAAVIELRRLFLVEDLVDSIKFGVLLWVLTYIGSWFNGMTLVIIAWVTLFTLPKVYEANQAQIDANIEIVRVKIADITAKVKAAIPLGKKTAEKTE